NVACDTVVTGACAYARENTVAVRASASSEGVRPRVDPRKPIRSARVVSRVISITLGFGCARGPARTADATSTANAAARERIKKGRVPRGPAPHANPESRIPNPESLAQHPE